LNEEGSESPALKRDLPGWVTAVSDGIAPGKPRGAAYSDVPFTQSRSGVTWVFFQGVKYLKQPPLGNPERQLIASSCDADLNERTMQSPWP
jgi:hypothetical protein